MDLPILTPRLKLIAELVKQNSMVADVGTDHGYIPVYLVKKGVCSSAFAGDIGEGPLENAKRTIARFGVSDKVTPLLSSGLREFPRDCVDTVIIAGMGGDQIAAIIEECDWVHKSNVTLILQPMSMHEKCRVLLARDGFVCEMEEYVKEGNRLYTVMAYRYSHSHEISEITSHIGLAADSDSPLAKEYIRRRAEKLSRMAAGMEKSEHQKDEAVKLREIIDEINVAVCK